jgi:hypothetical protein
MLALILSALLLLLGSGIAIYSALNQTLTPQHLAILAVCVFLLTIALVLSAIERHLNAMLKAIQAHKDITEHTERHIIELVRRTPAPTSPSATAEHAQVAAKPDKGGKAEKPPTLEDW